MTSWERSLPRREPERTCIVTRAVNPPEGLIRFVVGPDGDVVPDLRRRLPGRGAWVTATADKVAEAVKRRQFGRAFKQEVRAAPDLPQVIETALREDLRQALSLANKAGAALSGFAKVESAIAAGPLAALLHAREAAPDGRRKLAGALRKRLGDAISAFPVVDDLSGDELDLALGRPHVIHAALVAGAGSEGFLARWRRLRAYRGQNTTFTGPDGAGPTTDREPAGPGF